MSTDPREKRDLVLAPGTYAYMQDVTKGQIIVFTGPTVINQTAQEVPVIYEPQDGSFHRCGTLEEAVRQAPIAVEGYYMILKNPARKAEHPMEGGRQIAPELEVGRKIIMPGPCMFALWPGQDAQVIRGHHLRSNQYLLVRVYNEEEARKNWAQAVIKPATSEPGPAATLPRSTVPAPDDLAVGRHFIIRGIEVSFYIPPTGIVVVPEGEGGSAKAGYVREALTLERLEYCILVDEDGNKRYERGPEVVFPEPTERFVENKDGGKKFRAIELNEIQGLHIKVIAPYTDEAHGKSYQEGDELFITGKETAIYFPRQEHSLISYDGKSKHFASAVPAGEARYVMNRMSGQIAMVKGPAMLLPDPRHEVIVRRVLSEKQVTFWYPGNQEALEYNRQLRHLLSQAPTTRQGAISEGDVERGMRKAAQQQQQKGQRGMEQSRVSGDQVLVADEFSRASTYTQPRTVTLDTKFQGVPSIDVWTGYAIMVVSKTGKRRVERGPTTVLLEYDESLEVLELSTGKPKTTDSVLRTVFLRVVNNKVSDIISVETLDHVGVEIYLSHRVNFEAEATRWFEVENYVKFLCDHVRSVLKGALKKVRVEDFYANSADIIRDIILGKAQEGKRAGMFFPENGMHVLDVEVLRVTIGDERIRKILEEAQHDAVKSHIELTSARRNLEVTREKEGIEREIAETRAVTTKRIHELDVDGIASKLAVVLAQIGSQLRQEEEKRKAEAARQAVLDMTFDSELARQLRDGEQREALARAGQEREIERLRAEALATIERFQAAQPGFSEALLALSHEETIVKVAEALSVQNFVGGKTFVDVVQKVFAGTPLQPLLDRLTASARKDGDGHGRAEAEAE